MSHSRERITSFAPWLTHGVELHIARKMPQCMHNMWPYIEKELCHLPQKDIPVNYEIIGYESHLHSLRRHQRGTLFFTKSSQTAIKP